MMRPLLAHRFLLFTGFFLGGVLLAFAWRTQADLRPLPKALAIPPGAFRKVQVLDRHGAPLTVTYQNRWNLHDRAPLHEVPHFLQDAFLFSEDRRFWAHAGVDWRARLHALWQNLKALEVVRGASTISEQVVRMLHPRQRTVWSRWLEGFEAASLEKRFGKTAILEFYLNQVPYAAQRRGVVQAARYYFDRDLDTLSHKEMLALTVLVRAPGRMDLRRHPGAVEKPIQRLAEQMHAKGMLTQSRLRQIQTESFQLAEARLPVRASHFVQHALSIADQRRLYPGRHLYTTLDRHLQQTVQAILDQRLQDLRGQTVYNGAALVVDHVRNEVLAWTVGGSDFETFPGSQYDAVLIPRQPGSTLKPFLYALALADGWTAATLIDDVPLTESVGIGLHTYHNYSRGHYGQITLREALGNSLNIPAVKTIQFVGPERFLNCLRRLGIESLAAHPDRYGDGLALGNGALSLLELVRAYSVLARGGLFRPLTVLQEGPRAQAPQRIFSEEVCSLIANILADPEARRLEFGNGSLLRFPVQTAVKTGTSSDYRDAWAVGFNYRYTAGVWIGNLDHAAMDGVTGSTGPALVLRAIFAELNRHRETRPLYLSPRLVKIDICKDSGLPAPPGCVTRTEWFVPGTAPENRSFTASNPAIRIRRPTPGLQLARDPRIPDAQEAFEFVLTAGRHYEKVEWYVDRQFTAQTREPRYLWPLEAGEHTVTARVWLKGVGTPIDVKPVRFWVK